MSKMDEYLCLKYFQPDEFKKANPSCDIHQMDLDFLQALNAARERAKVPFIINSAFRTSTHEKNMGRSGTSFHTEGIAVDLACHTSYERHRILSALLADLRFSIGIASNYLHVDFRAVRHPEKHSKSIIFLY